MSTAGKLLDRLTSSETVAPALRDDLIHYLAKEAKRVAPLEVARETRRANRMAAIRRAADQVLTPQARAVVPRKKWPGKLLPWLKRHHREVGLERCPSRETIRTALINLERSYASVETSRYSRANIEAKGPP